MPPEEIDYSEWIGRTEAARRLGISIAVLRKREAKGDLKCVKTERGGRDVVLFDPDQFDELDEDAGIDDAPTDMPEMSAAAIVQAASSLVKEAKDYAHKAFDSMIKLVDSTREQSDSLHKTLSEVVQNQQKQNLDLQQKNFDMRQQFEESLSQQHARRMLEEAEKAKNELRARIWGDMQPYMSVVVQGVREGVKAKWGIDLPIGAPPQQVIPPAAGSAPSPAAGGTGEKTDVDKKPESIDQNPWRGLYISMTVDMGKDLYQSGKFPMALLQEVAEIRSLLEKSVDVDKDEMLLIRADQLLSNLTEEQKTILRAKFNPLQTIYFDSIFKAKETMRAAEPEKK